MRVTAFAVVVCLSVVGCSSTPPSPATPTVVRVGYIPISECAHMYVGIAKRFFEEEGLNIELKALAGGAAILPALEQGDLDIGFTNVVTLIAQNARRPVDEGFVSVAGASYERQGRVNHALLTRADATLTPEDLISPNTKIAINTTRNVEELMLRRFLDKRGISAGQLNLVPKAFPEMLGALDRGEVSVVSVVEPFIEPALRTGKYKLLANQYLEVAPETVVATYVATQKWYLENRTIVQKFQSAFTRAARFIEANDSEMRQIVGRFARGISPESMHLMGMPAFEDKLKLDPLSELAAEMIRFKFIQAVPDLSKMIAN